MYTTAIYSQKDKTNECSILSVDKESNPPRIRYNLKGSFNTTMIQILGNCFGVTTADLDKSSTNSNGHYFMRMITEINQSYNINAMLNMFRESRESALIIDIGAKYRIMHGLLNECFNEGEETILVDNPAFEEFSSKIKIGKRNEEMFDEGFNMLEILNYKSYQDYQDNNNHTRAYVDTQHPMYQAALCSRVAMPAVFVAFMAIQGLTSQYPPGVGQTNHHFNAINEMGDNDNFD
jgi:hypothetical protein